MMSEDTEQAVLNVAKYLRDVRPLDPAELTEYVSEPINPGEISSILRSNSPALEIYEREDGTFAPVPAEPTRPPFDGIDQFPEGVTEIIEDELRDAFGPDWFAGRSGDQLREAIRTFKSAYFAAEPVEYDRTTALGYAIYHLPGTYAKTQYVLDVLGQADLISCPLRMLEVGTGVGGGVLGVAAYVGPDWPIEYHGVEPSQPSINLCKQLLHDRTRNLSSTFDRATIEETDLSGTYDLILLGNVLNEVTDPIATVSRLENALSPDGSIVAFEPADKRTARTLRVVERGLFERQSELDIYAPTLRLWAGEHASDDCWSFVEREPIAVPSFQRKLDEGPRRQTTTRDPATGEFINTDIRVAYSILRSDGKRRHAFRANREHVAPLADSESHVGQRVHLAVVKLSQSLADEDTQPLYVIGDGSQQTRHFAVHTEQTSLNQSLATATYGTIISMQHALILWNSDESAYNVIVDEQTIVDRIG